MLYIIKKMPERLERYVVEGTKKLYLKEPRHYCMRLIQAGYKAQSRSTFYEIFQPEFLAYRPIMVPFAII